MRPARNTHEASAPLATLLCLLLAPAIVAAGPDISDRLTDLGNKPAEWGQNGTSRNVWDLQVYDGKVFIGLGSTVHNTGPQPIWAFDHATGLWGDEPETVIDQAAIEIYRVFDGDLFIPSADPKAEVGDRSKFYRRDPDGSWTHFISSPGFNTAHIRDLVVQDGWVIGVGNSRRPHDLLRAGSGSVALPLKAVRNTRGGERELPLFRDAITTLPPHESGGLIDAGTSQRNRMANWFFAAFELHDGLYASTRWLGWAQDDPEPEGVHGLHPMYPPQVPPFPAVVRWDTGIDQWVAPDPDEVGRLVPATPERDTQLTLRPYKPVLFGELWFAPLRSYGISAGSYKDAYNQSADFVVKAADEPGRRVTLPDANALGEAVLVHENRLYVLANARQASGSYRVVVYALEPEDARAENLDDATGLAQDVWAETLSFRDANLARSFARIDDTWYFGLGFATGDPPGRAGTLLRYEAHEE